MIRWSFFLLLTACGSNAVDDVFIGDGGVFPVDATVDVKFGGGDSPYEGYVDTGQFTGGGPFLCENCICDGTLNMCAPSSGGGAPIVDAGNDADDDAGDAAPLCNADAAPTACVVIPTVCLPKPTCACIEKAISFGCTCSIDPSGNGFDITCPPKP